MHTCLVLNDQGGGVMNVTDNVTNCLRAQDHGHPPLVLCSYGFKPEQGAKAQGMGWEKEISPSLTIGPGCMGGVLVVCQAVHENQQAVVWLSDVTGALSTGGGKPGSGYQCVLLENRDGSP